MKYILAFVIALSVVSNVKASPVEDIFETLASFDKGTYEGFEGYLFKSWLQIDPSNPNYVIYMSGRRYNVILDDGRATSMRANECPDDAPFGQRPTAGCHISFDGELIVNINDASMEIQTKIWNVKFLN